MKNIILLFFLFLWIFNVSAQPARKKYFAVGINGGVSNYKGDLDDNLNPQFFRPAYGIHALYLFSDRLNIRLSAFRGTITANDDYQSVTSLRNRNLSFFSPITEGAISIIIKPFRKRGNEFSRLMFTPYLFGGVAFFKFNPQASYNGSTYYLHSMGTEGQNLGSPYPRIYSLSGLSVPFGVGLLYRLNYRWDLGIECGPRKTFTDYLDDVSGPYPDIDLLRAADPVAAALSDRQRAGTKRSASRGNSGANDWYIYTNVNLTYYFYISKKGKNGSNNCIKVRM
jgi:hypothetical protein